MKVIDASGAKLSAKSFISYYDEAKKLAPPRFLSLRLHPTKYLEIYALADIPKSIQVGATPGPVGRSITRVACITPPLGISDGIAIIQDTKAPPDRLVFEIHGIQELVIQNLYTEVKEPSSEPTNQVPQRVN